MISTLQQAAQAAANRAARTTNSEAFFDPESIGTFIEIFKQIFECIKNRQGDPTTVEEVRDQAYKARRNPIVRWRLRQQVRQSIEKNERTKAYVKECMYAVLDTCDEANDNELAAVAKDHYGVEVR